MSDVPLLKLLAFCKKSIKKRGARDRAPSRICLKKINSLFCKKGVVKAIIKKYINYCVPFISSLKLMVRRSVRAAMLNRMEYYLSVILILQRKFSMFVVLVLVKNMVY